MTKLFISKHTEAKAVATIWNMGGESLNPDDYAELERLLARLCATRTIHYETVGVEQIMLSNKKRHHSDCGVHNAPCMLPTPCNCDLEP